MLVISRKAQESIRIEPAAGLDPSLTLREVFQSGPILLKLVHIGQRRVRLVIDAPTPLRVWRGEPRLAEDARQLDSSEDGAREDVVGPAIGRVSPK